MANILMQRVSGRPTAAAHTLARIRATRKGSSLRKKAAAGLKEMRKYNKKEARGTSKLSKNLSKARATAGRYTALGFGYKKKEG